MLTIGECANHRRRVWSRVEKGIRLNGCGKAGDRNVNATRLLLRPLLWRAKCSANSLKFTVFDDWKAWVGAVGRIFSFYLGFRIETAAVADDWVLWEQAGWVKLLS